MKYSEEENPYMYLVTYSDIYHELVFERNEVIRWLSDHAMLARNKFVKEVDKKEWEKHKSAYAHRLNFQDNVMFKLDRLYSYDAVEAMYNFESIDLGNWSDTEANRLEKQLNQLQLIIGKLEVRYKLSYKLTLEYKPEELTLFLNSIKVFSCGGDTLRHKILTTLYSEPGKRWSNQGIEDYFIDNFGYKEGDLADSQIEKAALDINTDVAKNTALKKFLLPSKSTLSINSKYLH